MHHFAYRDGVLHAEAVNLDTLAAAVGTPFYCYSTATLERHYQVFAGAFADVEALVCYAMRKGAQGLAQSMQQQGMGPGPNGRPGRGQARAQQDTDPLGRPMRGRDYGDDVTVKVPGEIDAQRARRILEELRKRFGESFRPQLELDYIERLLKDF